jgi:hypothetical protein
MRSKLADRSAARLHWLRLPPQAGPGGPLRPGAPAVLVDQGERLRLSPVVAQPRRTLPLDPVRSLLRK